MLLTLTHETNYLDLTKLLTEWTGKGYNPLLLGDFNLDITEKHLEKFISANNLIDIIAENNDDPRPGTYSRGKNVLDYALGDDFVNSAVVQAGSLGLHEGILSDHTMQWIDFDIQALFGNKTYTPMLPSDRQFTLQNAKKKHKFQEKLQELHDKHKIRDKVMNLADEFAQLASCNLESEKMMELLS